MKSFIKCAFFISLYLFLYMVIQIICLAPIVLYTFLTDSAKNFEFTSEMLALIQNRSIYIIPIAIALTMFIYYIIIRSRYFGIRDVVQAEYPGIRRLAGGAFCGMGFWALTAVFMSLPVWDSFMRDYETKINTLMSTGLIARILIIALIAPVFEELLFRGIIFWELKNCVGAKVAIIIQAVIFGLYHGNIIQGIYASLLGIALGILYYNSKSIFVPMLAHITFNAAGIIIPEFVQSGEMGLAILFGSLFLLALGLKNVKKAPGEII